VCLQITETSSCSLREQIYTPLDEALAELQRRRADAALCRAVEHHRRQLPAELFEGTPAAVLWRHIMTPGLEFLRFSALARRSGLRPLCLEYLSDKFVPHNPDKHMLAMMHFRFPDTVRRLRVVDFAAIDGTPLGAIHCRTGQSLVDFHHRLLESQCPETLPVDISDWVKQLACPEQYYFEYLSLFITSGIIFEVFLLDDPKERAFAEDRVFPAVARVVETYGVKPLIVRLVEPEEEGQSWLWEYPRELQSVAKKLLFGSPNEGARQPLDRCGRG